MEGLEYVPAIFNTSNWNQTWNTSTKYEVKQKVETSINVVKKSGKIAGPILTVVGYTASVIPHPAAQAVSKPLILAGSALSGTAAGIGTVQKLKAGDLSGAAIEAGSFLAGEGLNASVSCLKGANQISKFDEAVLRVGIETKAQVADIISAEINRNSVKSIDSRISERKSILEGHRQELSNMQNNKDNFTSNDFKAVYQKLDYDYKRLNTLRKEKSSKTESN